MTKDETLKQTLTALEVLTDSFADVSAYEDDEHAFTNELIFIPDIKKAIKAIAAAKQALAQPVQEATCPECKAKVLYECVACSSNNYPPAAQPEERNFCQRCGKRTADLITIHTCTPPQIDPNQWAFDNGLEST
jgi:DNA-directed RNA polymerase subunit RPC12/RpoP